MLKSNQWNLLVEGSVLCYLKESGIRFDRLSRTGTKSSSRTHSKISTYDHTKDKQFEAHDLKREYGKGNTWLSNWISNNIAYCEVWFYSSKDVCTVVDELL
jgi:hypothetical protein